MTDEHRRCDKCYRKLDEDNTSKDPGLCRPCYGLVHQFDHLRSGVPNERDFWA